MTASDFHGKPVVPDSVKRLDADVVVEVLSRHGVNVSDAADELNVASADLRRLLWARPGLMDAAEEIEERRLDLAEKNIFEALKSDDSRRRDAASMFTLRDSARARRRGWITSASSVDISVTNSQPARQVVFRWRTDADDKLDAEAARAREEGKQVISIGWRNPDDSKLVGHEAKPEPSDKE
jgi:hypothetical protein